MPAPFYESGLRFACKRCSACCRGGPGHVFLSKSDLARLLDFLKLDFAPFVNRYCVFVDMGGGFALSLTERKNYDCVFWGEGGCQVYDARPIQCSTFPFWASIMESEEEWLSYGQTCPGIQDGPLCDKEVIHDALFRRRAAGTLLFSREEAEHPESIDEDSLLGR